MVRSYVLLLVAASALATAILATAAEKKVASIKLLDDEMDEYYRGLLPDSEDGKLQGFKKDTRVVFYNETVMPRAHQDATPNDNAGTMFHGVHDSYHNIGGGGDPFGNGNREFPWGRPAGTNPDDGATSYKFFRIPEDTKVKLWKETMGGERLIHRGTIWHYPADSGQVYVWEFPVGTIFGEVLVQKTGDTRKNIVWEVRTRTKTKDGWVPQVYRPYASPEALAAAILRLPVDPAHATAVKALGNPVIREERVVDSNHPTTSVIDRTGYVEVLPELPAKSVTSLLRTKFQTVFARPWRNDDKVVHGVTVDSGYSLVVPGFKGGTLEVTKKSCMTCHESAQQHVMRFDIQRDWYGRVRGTHVDKILSWHPFDEKCISKGAAQKVEIRPELKSILDIK